MTIGQWLAAATTRLAEAGSASPPLDAELLLAAALGRGRSRVLADLDSALGAGRTAADALLARRAEGEPVAYLTGQREFFGLTLSVTPEVLIPRPETEHLVEAALELLPMDTAAMVADLGTGAGGLAVAVARHRPQARLIATDVSPTALAVAAGNAARHGVSPRIGFRLGVGYQPVAPDEALDLIVANLPYLPSDSLADSDLRYEPRLALDGGPDGLDHYRDLLADSASHPFPPPCQLWEIDPRQTTAVEQLTWSAGYQVRFLPDLARRPRVAALTRSTS